MIATRNREVRGIAGAGEGETFLEPRSRPTEYNDGVRAPRRIRARPDEEDSRERQNDRDHHAEQRQTPTQGPPAPPVLHWTAPTLRCSWTRIRSDG